MRYTSICSSSHTSAKNQFLRNRFVMVLVLMLYFNTNSQGQKLYLTAGPQCSVQLRPLIQTTFQYGAKGALGLRFPKHRLELAFGYHQLGGLNEVFTSGNFKTCHLASILPLHPKQLWSLRLLGGASFYRINQRDIDTEYIQFKNQHISMKCLMLGAGLSYNFKGNFLATLDYCYENPFTTEYNYLTSNWATINLGVVYVLSRKEKEAVKD